MTDRRKKKLRESHSIDLGGKIQAYALNHRYDSPREKNLREIQFRIGKKDETIQWIEHVCKPVKDEQGAFVGFRVSNRDITKHRLTQEESQQLRSELIHPSRVAALIERTKVHAPETANGLQTLIDSFQLGRIRDLLGDAT
jgi:hypothetical protein